MKTFFSLHFSDNIASNQNSPWKNLSPTPRNVLVKKDKFNSFIINI